MTIRLDPLKFSELEETTEPDGEELIPFSKGADNGSIRVKNLPSSSGGATNLSTTLSATNTIINSDSGTDATIPAADSSNAGVLTAAKSDKLDDIEAGATANSTDAQLRDRSTHTGSQAMDTVTGLPAALDGKVDDADITSFETTTQLNARDTANRARSNHTGTQPVSTVDGLQAALDAKLDDSQKGSASGLAELDGSGKVPSAQLPSFVDDVIEAANFAALPATGETAKIYVTLDNNKTYRWSGSAYVEISESLALGETSTTAYRGDRGKTAYDHSQLVSGNPHAVTKSDVGLPNADNTSDLAKPISTATQAALDDKADNSDITAFETTTQLNARDTANRARANHTGNQPASTISDFDTEVSNNADVAANTTARHSHSNKALLDTYDQTNANLTDAVSKKHAHSNQSVLDNTTASFTTADETKLDGIESGADVTDTTNVAAAGAVMNGGSVSTIIKLTQAAYDALTPDANTLYVIVG